MQFSYQHLVEPTESFEASPSLALRSSKRMKGRSKGPIPPGSCTPFQFSKCSKKVKQDNKIRIQAQRNAWDCSQHCTRKRWCKSWIFKRGKKHGTCWLSKKDAGKTVKKVCSKHQGTVLPFKIVKLLDQCIEENYLYNRNCKVRNRLGHCF